MSPETRAAHLRLLETLPKRTHHQRERPRLAGRPKVDRRQEVERMLRETDLRQIDIAAALGISRIAVQMHVRALRASGRLPANRDGKRPFNAKRPRYG